MDIPPYQTTTWMVAPMTHKAMHIWIQVVQALTSLQNDFEWLKIQTDRKSSQKSLCKMSFDVSMLDELSLYHYVMITRYSHHHWLKTL